MLVRLRVCTVGAIRREVNVEARKAGKGGQQVVVGENDYQRERL
jgi:hypothetical protein